MSFWSKVPSLLILISKTFSCRVTHYNTKKILLKIFPIFQFTQTFNLENLQKKTQLSKLLSHAPLNQLFRSQSFGILEILYRFEVTVVGLVCKTICNPAQREELD